MKYNIYINYLNSHGLLDTDNIKNFYQIPDHFSWRNHSPKVSGNLTEIRYLCKNYKRVYKLEIYQIKPVPINE